MKRYWFLVVLFAVVFFETTIIPFNLLLVALAAWTFCRQLRQLMILAWLSGLLLDFLLKVPLGFNALFFLVFVFILYFARQKFIHTTYELSLKTVAPLLITAVFLGEISWQIFIALVTSSFVAIGWINVLTTVILALLFFPFVSYLSRRWQDTEQLELRF